MEEIMAMVQTLMLNVFTDPEGTSQRAKEIGTAIGTAAMEQIEADVRAIVHEECQPIRDLLILLSPAIEQLGTILGNAQEGRGGLVGKKIASLMEAASNATSNDR